MHNETKIINGIKIIPPHLNAEFYRTLDPKTSFISGLDYIRISPDGAVLIGSSDHTARKLTGQACIYKTIADAYQQQTYNPKSIFLNSGTNDGCFIENSDKVFLCEDSGAVSVWTKSSGKDVWHDWVEDISVSEHDDAALVVDCLYPGKDYVTAGADGNIKVWDISMLICMKNYLNAHSHPIYGLAVRPQSNTDFASGSMDQYLNLWSDNTEKSVLELHVSDCSIRCLAWINENQLIFGNEAGALKLVDIRNPDTVTKLTEFPAAVHRLAVNSDCSKVAVCCDNKMVSVCEITEGINCKVGYQDRHLHTEFVRGLAWDVQDKNVLHSVGWGAQIKTHQLFK
ncbi:hypothetical protein K1T71_000356 [Dendrolimus kikuchii]|uniref:Uncharacterized protein n=1 Tax=Dendrolimus kikuchii TaxID=765133 RepID=A0ACC1DIY2_9NEOP|nr:hypothetical protein K1T71_000356 [Dendrolimus kikuchii]